MGAIAHLDTKTLAVTPGGVAVAEIRVRNGGAVVDQFTVWVLGDAEAWATVEPATLSLLPGDEEKARVTFSPPRSPDVPAGAIAFGLHVQSKEDPAGSIVEEGVLEVGAFADTFAELVPRTSRGSRGATHDLAVDNRGNARLNATISAADPDRLLEFDVNPPAVVADPGTAAFSKVQVRPRERFWRGPPKTRSFRVQVESPEGVPYGVDGTLLQEAILPAWFLRALLALLALVIAAVLFWLFFLGPTIESTARERTEEILASLGITPPPAAVPGGGGGGGGGGGASPTAGGGGGSPAPGTSPGAPTPGGTGPPLAGGGQATVGRITAGGPPLTLPDGQNLYITDLVFSNPTDTQMGELTLSRSGTVLISLQLQNFRDLDFHFVTPITVQGAAQDLSLACGGCTASVFYSGYIR